MSFDARYADLHARAPDTFTEADKSMCRLFYYHGVHDSQLAMVDDMRKRIDANQMSVEDGVREVERLGLQAYLDKGDKHG